MENAIFPSILETADVIPVFKKDNKTNKNNYQAISILPNISKIFERCMYQQISAYFEENIFSKYQCAFRKGCSAQHCFLLIIKKWKAFLYQEKSFIVFLADQSEVFDRLPQDILIAKLNSYGFEEFSF